MMKTFVLTVSCLLATLHLNAQSTFYGQWNLFYGQLNSNNEITNAFETYNADHNWMKHPFKASSLRTSFRLLDFSAGLILNAWRLEAGWNTPRYFFEAYNLDPNPNASDIHQYVRLKITSFYLGTGFCLGGGLISPGVNIELGNIHLNTIQQKRSTRFNKRNQDFRNAEDEGLKTFLPRLNVNVQFRVGYNANEDEGGYILIEPYVMYSLKSVDFSPFDVALNNQSSTQVNRWRPIFYGIKLGIGFYKS